jgi:hypothetical protein
MCCFAGCETKHVLAVMGLTLRDLFTAGDWPKRARPSIVASYPYHDRGGRLIARKVRLEPKSFRWQRHQPSGPREWVWGLDSLQPSLYRLPDLQHQRTVFCLEGEKAVDAFWTAGLVATCPPSGASRWIAAWSEDLQRADCCELVILPDADQSGLAHAERVAAASFAIDMQVKLVRLPGLRAGADAYDWLHDGGTVAELLKIVSGASWWFPGTLEHERLERRRELTRERVRRHREKKRLLAGTSELTRV